MRDFDMSISRLSGRIVVSLTGELDFDACPGVARATDSLPLHGSILTLDLSDVTFMDSTSLNMLLRLRRRAEAEGGVLELRGLREQARRVLEITGTQTLFHVLPTPPAASPPPSGGVVRGTV
ncbi:STAS domain-containing protein [Streptomyces sp. SCSIO 30461]|uniref:STAS domain-containing protein n=1 Tax=Streptomyces sp. SCSIO 30461 TaxID=3118085 RepID=UPI0030D3CDA1